MSTTSCCPNSLSWGQYWRSGIAALIAVIQLFVSFAVVGLQTAIVVIGIVFLCNSVTTRYVMGFVCWAFFLACWISVFCVTCCNRSSVCCATYTLVKNVLAFIFSCVLISFDRQFINNPYFDYQPNYNYNSATYYSNGFCSVQSDSNIDFWSISVSLAKGQLAGAVIILVTSLAYVGLYIYVYIRSLQNDRRMPKNPVGMDGQNALKESRF